MKLTYLFTAGCILMSFFSNAQNITTPADASPAGTVSQTIGISKITVTYSRPSVRGREVWGNLAHYGLRPQGFGLNNPAPWRAGANENTTLTLSDEATIGGKKVLAGTYGLFYAVNEDNTALLILSREHRAWGSYFYDSTDDVLRTRVQLKSIPHTELLTFDFQNLTRDKAELVLNWEKKQFPVDISFNVDALVIENARKELKGPLGFQWQGFASAAAYTLQSKGNYEQGLEWIDQALRQQENFTTLNTKAALLRAVGKVPEADETRTKAMALATETELNQYGYQLMGNGQIDEALEVFITNTRRNPKSPNAFDSLGEAFFNKGDKKNAAINFKKALSLNPQPNVKVNSERFLERIAAGK